MILLTLIFSILYALMILYFYSGWKNYKFPEKSADPKISLSVIIPARNEEDNILNLLQDLQQQDYPQELIEIIVVDDHSEDDTARKVLDSGFANVRLLYLQHYLDDQIINAYKKKALEVGIKAAENDYIVTTDADCRVGEKWLSSIAAVLATEKYKVVAGPVVLHQEQNVLHYFQSLDLLGLMGITAATIQSKYIGLSNGANFAYAKSTFEEVHGFKKIDQVASGDDMLLMRKILKKYPDQAAFLKDNNAVVKTMPAATLPELMRQRIRWTSKTRHQSYFTVTAVLAFAYLFHLQLLLLFLISFFDQRYLPLFLVIFLAKFIPENILIRSTAAFFNKKNLMSHFFISELIHIFYVLLIGILGIFAGYHWKGRSIK